MTHTQITGLGLLVAALTVAGCSRPSATKETGAARDSGKKKEEHAHGKGPNGGVVFDLGKYHAEFTVDHDKKECTLLVLGDDEKTPTPVAAKGLIVNTKETRTKEGKIVAPMTITMLPRDEAGGKASRFVGADPGLGNVADFEGIAVGEINGKPSQGTFKED